MSSRSASSFFSSSISFIMSINCCWVEESCSWFKSIENKFNCIFQFYGFLYANFVPIEGRQTQEGSHRRLDRRASRLRSRRPPELKQTRARKTRERPVRRDRRNHRRHEEASRFPTTETSPGRPQVLEKEIQSPEVQGGRREGKGIRSRSPQVKETTKDVFINFRLSIIVFSLFQYF